MRIFIHDYGRFPFILQLAKELAKRERSVTYAYSDAVSERADVNVTCENLELFPVAVKGELSKKRFILRFLQEVKHGLVVTKELERIRPDIVVSANTPLDPQTMIWKWCRSRRTPFVYWVQDLVGLASFRILKSRMTGVGMVIGYHYMKLEKFLIRNSDEVLIIADTFYPYIESVGADSSRIHIFENWAPLDEMPTYDKVNDWSIAHGLADKEVVLYSGTIGFKHDPGVLLSLARRLQERPNARLVLISEGSAVAQLAEAVQSRHLDNVVILPFQEYRELPQALASADVLLAVLAHSAGDFSIPSKVLTYFCAGRAQVLAVPLHNRAVGMVTESGAGIAIAPNDEQGLCDRVFELLDRPALRLAMGTEARKFAEEHFDIKQIADRFERICSKYANP